jgi:hypothetical protein
VLELPLWEGDRAFLCRLRNTTDFFTLKLIYKNDKLIEIV